MKQCDHQMPGTTLHCELPAGHKDLHQVHLTDRTIVYDTGTAWSAGFHGHVNMQEVPQAWKRAAKCSR